MSIYEQVAAIKANDEQAMRRLYIGNFAAVHRFVTQNNGSADDAKDVYQEAYLSVWRNIQLDKFKPQTGATLEGYLFQIARNKWLDQLRSLRYKNTTNLSAVHEELTQTDSTDDSLDRINAIKQNFQKLGASCRRILFRYYFKGDSMKTIASEMNWTEATAKNNKYRCMERLRSMTR